MDTIIRIAESIAKLYDQNVLRLDIQLNVLKGSYRAFLILGDNKTLCEFQRFEIEENGCFRKASL